MKLSLFSNFVTIAYDACDFLKFFPMNRFLISFFALSLAFFLVGAVRFFFPQTFTADFWNFQQENQQEENRDETKAPENLERTLEEQIVAETPEDETALFLRAQKFFDQGILSFAERDLTLLLQKNPRHQEGLLLLTKIHIRLRNFAAAEALATQALAVFPQNAEFTLLLGDLYVQQKKFAEARAIFSELPESDVAKNFYLGVISIAEENYEAARTFLQQTAQNEVFRERSNLLLAAFREFDLFPDGNPLHLQTLLAKSLNDVALFEVSLELSKKVLLEDTSYRDAWLTNGYSYLALERYEFAKNAFQRAFEIDPTSAVTAYYLGLTLKSLGDFQTALSVFERASQNGFEPEIELLKQIADTNYLAENYERALQTWEEILADSAGSAADFVRPMNIALTLLQKPETGVVLGEWAVEKHPQEAMAWNLRGWAYLENNELGKAESDLQQALQLNPDFAAAQLNFGLLREKEERYEEALEYYEAAYQADALGAIGQRAAERYNALLE